MTNKILVVDDEEDLLELVKYNLTKEGFDVECVTSGEEAIRVTQNILPDLILLDLMLSGTDGFTVTKILKSDSKTASIPIVILSAKGEEIDIVTGLELGAEDYITKPFSPKILLARVKTILRRNENKHQTSNNLTKIHEISIDSNRFAAQVNEIPVELSLTEFKLLSFLARRPGWVFTRNQIISAVRGDDCAVTDRSVDVHIVSLRKKLGSAGKYIESIRGVGYRFKE
ncbi:MAG: response regulator [Candidatus Riflebacteria bacterium]|nr:response regulator [Candidatus Riflebacteria bacterium]